MKGLTQRLAELTVEWTHPDTSTAYDLAERAFTDTVAVALAAVGDATVQTVLAATRKSFGHGRATVLVTGEKASSRDAALLGGVSAHALDFDDVDDAMIGHPSAPLVPALLAVGEECGATGTDVLNAYWVGLASCRILADALGIDTHYAVGWHSTGTIGTIAVAAATARLRRLTVDQVRRALGIAGSLAAGSRQNFGTMTKPLHAGAAAANGVLASGLAAAGLTADPAQLEGPLGFLALHHGQANGGTSDEDQVVHPQLNVKLHPCCYRIHCAADAALELHGDGLTAADIRQVDVTVQPRGLDPLIHHRPNTGLQGKFSMEYAIAACLLDGRLRLETFTDAQVARPAVQHLLRKVRADTRQAPPTGPVEPVKEFAVVTVHMSDGSARVARVDAPRGHASRPLTEDELRRKFDDCLRFSSIDDCDGLFFSLRHLRRTPDVGQIVAKIAAATTAVPA